MPRFEYKVVPAPIRGAKAKGVRGTEARFANTVQMIMNEQAAEGWAYLRTDSLPCEERQGLRGRITVFQNLLVFQREITEIVDLTQRALPSAPARRREPSVSARTPEPQTNSKATDTLSAEQSAALGEISQNAPTIGNNHSEAENDSDKAARSVD